MGLIAAFLSAFFHASKDLMSKKISFAVDGGVSTFASFLFALPFYGVLLALLWILGYEDFALSADFLWLVVARSLTDAVAEWCKMHAFELADVSVVSSFLSLSPVFLLVTSPLITGDALTVAAVGGILLVVSGSLVLLLRRRGQSSAVQGQGRGVWFAIVSAFFMSLNTCFDRLAVQTASAPLSGFAMTALAAVMVAPMLIKRRKEVVSLLRRHQSPFWSRGALELGFMVSKLYALQHFQAPYVLGIQKSSLLLQIVGGRVFFGERELMRRLLSGLLIFLGVVLIVWKGL